MDNKFSWLTHAVLAFQFKTVKLIADSMYDVCLRHIIHHIENNRLLCVCRREASPELLRIDYP